MLATILTGDRWGQGSQLGDAYGLGGLTASGGAVGTRANTDLRTRLMRWDALTAVGNNDARGIYGSVATASTHFWPEDGFWVQCTFALSDYTVGVQKWIVGLTVPTSWGINPITGAVIPSAIAGSLFVGQDPGDTLIYIMHDDGGGSATKVTTGYSITNDNPYMVTFRARSGGGDIDWTFRDMVAGTQSTDTITTNKPPTGGALRFGYCINNGNPSGGAQPVISQINWSHNVHQETINTMF